MTMQVNITGDNFPVSNALEQHVLDKLSTIEHKFSNITNAHVILSIEKFQHKAELTLHVPGAHSGSGELFATAKSKDMYQSINNLIPKVDKQLLAHKAKMKNHGKDMH